MVHYLHTLLLVVMMVPQLVAKQKGSTFSVVVEEQDSVMEDCIRAGLEVRYRFSVRVCARRRGWFDSCKNKRDDIRSIKYDPITAQYKIQKDRLGDGKAPTVFQVESKNRALLLTQSTDVFDLNFLAYGDEEFTARPRLYMEVRSKGYCKNETGDIENALSSLTFGVFEVNRFDSGWQSFAVEPEESAPEKRP
jgi:hypothetical protein